MERSASGGGAAIITSSMISSGGRSDIGSVNSCSDDDDFLDALDTPEEICFNVPVPPSHRRTGSEGSVGAKDPDGSHSSDDESPQVRKEILCYCTICG